MKRATLALLFFITPLSLPRFAMGATATAKSSSLKLRIAYAAPIGVMAPVWMAAESGALKAQGLDAELVLVEARAAIAALLPMKLTRWKSPHRALFRQ